MKLGYSRSQVQDRLEQSMPDVSKITNGEHAAFAPFLRAVTQTASIVPDVQNKIDELVKQKRYTDSGLRDMAREHVGKVHRNALAKLKADVEAGRAATAARRAALGKRTFPADDILGEMRRAEMRAILRSMPEMERMQAALSDDPAVRDAVLSVPPSMSGLSEAFFANVLTMAIDKEHVAEAAQLEALDEAADAAASAIALVEQDLGGLLTAALAPTGE